MAINNKTFSYAVDLLRTTDVNAAISEGLSAIDAQINDFMRDRHWSQVRDIIQTNTNVERATGSNPIHVLSLSRTVVYTTEILAAGAPVRPS